MIVTYYMFAMRYTYGYFFDKETKQLYILADFSPQILVFPMLHIFVLFSNDRQW